MKYSFTAVALAASYATAQTLPACGTTCINGVQSNLMKAPYNCAAGDIACFCRTPNYGYGIRDCTNAVCQTAAERMQAVQYGAQQCASAGVTSVGGLTSVTGSATGMMGTELGLGVPITTLTTTNEAGQTFLGTVIAQTGPAGRTTATTTLTGAAGGSTGGAGGAGGVVVAGGKAISTITTSNNGMAETEIVYAQTNSAGSTTASTTVTGGSGSATGGAGVVAGGKAISTFTTNENDMTVTEVVYAITNSAGSTTASTTVTESASGASGSSSATGAGGLVDGVAGVAISTITTSMNGMALTETVIAETNSAGMTTGTTTVGGSAASGASSSGTGAAGGMTTTGRMTTTGTGAAAGTSTRAAGGAAMQTAGSLMGAAGLAALLLL